MVIRMQKINRDKRIIIKLKNVHEVIDCNLKLCIANIKADTNTITKKYNKLIIRRGKMK